MAMLEVRDIHTYYGNIQALKGVTLDVNEGEIVTLIGSNGAGKSTTLRSISGLTPPREGSIVFRGQDIAFMPPQEIVRRVVDLPAPLEPIRVTISPCSTVRVIPLIA